MQTNNESAARSWAYVNVDGQAIIPVHDSNVGNWIHELQEFIDQLPRFWRIK
jgi:hypothetical protein